MCVPFTSDVTPKFESFQYTSQKTSSGRLATAGIPNFRLGTQKFRLLSTTGVHHKSLVLTLKQKVAVMHLIRWLPANAIKQEEEEEEMTSDLTSWKV